ncbi:MAG TPA: DinB family protein [Candidatus Acidoferrales bacterium]|nr:DinB family protein [Candidatus Acidoferrales bacterium]
MAARAIQQESIANKLVIRWKEVNRKLAALAEEVPESKYDYRAVDGARTIAEVLRHVAFWNRYVADSARGEKADDAANELPKSEFSTKAKIVTELQRSAEEAANALQESSSGLSVENAEMLITYIEHNCEHYGQLVVYARLNGIVPPASRG